MSRNPDGFPTSTQQIKEVKPKEVGVISELVKKSRDLLEINQTLKPIKNEEKSKESLSDIDINDENSLNKFISEFTESFLLIHKGDKLENTDEDRVFTKGLLKKRLEIFLVSDFVKQTEKETELNNEKKEDDPTKDKELRNFADIKKELNNFKNTDELSDISKHIAKLLSNTEKKELKIKIPTTLLTEEDKIKNIGEIEIKIDRPDSVIFEQLIDRGNAEAEEKKMKDEIGKRGEYRPIDGHGGDGYLIEKMDGGEKVKVIDTQGHGEGEFAKKSLILNLFNKAKGIPEEYPHKNIKNINSFLEKCGVIDGSTSTECSIISVKLENNEKKVSCEFYGANPLFIFEPETGEIFTRGVIRGDKLRKDGGNFAKLGILEDPFIQGSETYEDSFSREAQIIVSTDGVVDQTIRFKKDKDGGERLIGRVLEDFLDEWKNNKSLKLVDFLKNEVEQAEEIGDDITIIEVGASLK